MEGNKEISLVESSLQGHANISRSSLTDDKSSMKCEYRRNPSDPSCIVKKIYPSEAELVTINNSVQCTENNCKEIFTSQSNLNLHLYKTHNKLDAIELNSEIKQFFCPNIECIYHESECFKNKKLLKQHYLKVHSPKTYFCETCNEGFSSKVYKNMHVDYCGVIFKCNECPLSYRRYESLLTHARRKDHIISEKVSFKLVKPYNKPVNDTSKSKRLRTLLPHPSSSMQLLIITESSNKRCDQSIQTDRITAELDNKLSQIRRNPLVIRKNARKTQTSSKREKLSSETQTIGDYLKKEETYLKKQIGENNIKAQSSTQTHTIPSKSVSSNTILDVNNIEFLKSSDIKRTSSGTQTIIQSVNDIPYSSIDNIHSEYSVTTESPDLIVNNLFDKIFQNCNMETQTDFIFGDDLFNDCDYCSNMYTQTCEDMLLNSLELNNIETQTVDEMLRSVESQTTVSQNKRYQVNCRDINHMETQTDMEFKRIMEVINV